MITCYSSGWMKNIVVNTKKPIFLWIDLINDTVLPDGFNIFYVCEPRVINPHYKIIPWIIQNWKKFDLVLSHDDEVIQNCPNAKYFHWTSALINENEYHLFSMNKEFGVTFICGGKLMCQGHYIRRTCWQRQQEIKIPKELFYSTQVRGNLPILPENKALPIDTKACAFNKMFHITMENCQIKGYFSEKITDCFLTYTIPIYWGCPNIGDFFHTEGIIIVESFDKIIEIVNNLTEDDYYSRKEWMEKNRTIALNYPMDQPKGMLYHLMPILKEHCVV